MTCESEKRVKYLFSLVEKQHFWTEDFANMHGRLLFHHLLLFYYYYYSLLLLYYSIIFLAGNLIFASAVIHRLKNGVVIKHYMLMVNHSLAPQQHYISL